ncbi:MAG TPA: hypothetical protein VK325_09325, partial [Pseudoxanthomonas sp.]|nr:hypothetical protein [Pseudoxanthomonas sp.]
LPRSSDSVHLLWNKRQVDVVGHRDVSAHLSALLQADRLELEQAARVVVTLIHHSRDVESRKPFCES